MPPDSPFEPVAVDLRDYVDFSLETPTGRRAFATDVLALDVTCLEPNQAVEPRAFATADAIYTVLGGIAWVVTDEAEVTLQALQAVLVPAGVAHGIRNDGADPLILQVVTSPPDEAPSMPPGPAEPSESTTAFAPPPTLVDRLRRALGSG
jgi:mannose-6-phosphate isomerase-like protein (cupin superfamily)